MLLAWLSFVVVSSATLLTYQPALTNIGNGQEMVIHWLYVTKLVLDQFETPTEEQ